jgi:hypothetical protein
MMWQIVIGGCKGGGGFTPHPKGSYSPLVLFWDLWSRAMCWPIQIGYVKEDFAFHQSVVMRFCLTSISGCLNRD